MPQRPEDYHRYTHQVTFALTDSQWNAIEAAAKAAKSPTPAHWCRTVAVRSAQATLNFLAGIDE